MRTRAKRNRNWVGAGIEEQGKCAGGVGVGDSEENGFLKVIARGKAAMEREVADPGALWKEDALLIDTVLTKGKFPSSS